MKKLSRFALCLAAVISSVAFCFPAFASELEFGVEAGTEPAAAALPIEEESAKDENDASLRSDTGWEIFVPEFDGAISFRTAKPTGLRMRASVKQSIYRIDDDIDVEAGILVTLNKNLSDELTFESAESQKYPVVKGVGYLQENGTKKIDKLIPDMESGTTAAFTAIVTGVPDNALGYTSVFAFRPYFTIAGVNYYGDTGTTSLYAAAKDYKASESYVENEYIEHILTVSEAEKEPETLPASFTNKRIIKYSDPKRDSDKNYYFEYTVSNPYAGMLETLNGNKRDYNKYDEARYAIGDIVDVISDGTFLAVNDQADTFSGSVLAEESQYWILDYDAEGGKITITALPTNEDEVAAVENGTAQVYTLKVSDIYVSGDTPVTRIYNGAGRDLILWGSIAKAAVSDLGSQNKKFKAYTTYADSATDPLKEVYGKYIKAYIAIDWENADDHRAANEKTACNGTAQFVTIICNSDEPTYRCNLK